MKILPRLLSRYIAFVDRVESALREMIEHCWHVDIHNRPMFHTITASLRVFIKWQTSLLLGGSSSDGEGGILLSMDEIYGIRLRPCKYERLRML